MDHLTETINIYFKLVLSTDMVNEDFWIDFLTEMAVGIF